MQISRDFTIAIHTLLCIDAFTADYKVTSDFIASSVGVNPVIIRRMLIKLKDAGLIEVKAGTGGAHLLKSPESISFYDIYCAAGCSQRELFNFHEHPNPHCPVGGRIHDVLDFRLTDFTEALENKLRKTTLADAIVDLRSLR